MLMTIHTFCLAAMLITGPLEDFAIVVVDVGAMDMAPLKSCSRVFKYNIFYGLNDFLVSYCCLTVEKNATKDNSWRRFKSVGKRMNSKKLTCVGIAIQSSELKLVKSHNTFEPNVTLHILAFPQSITALPSHTDNEL